MQLGLGHGNGVAAKRGDGAGPGLVVDFDLVAGSARALNDAQARTSGLPALQFSGTEEVCVSGAGLADANERSMLAVLSRKGCRLVEIIGGLLRCAEVGDGGACKCVGQTDRKGGSSRKDVTLVMLAEAGILGCNEIILSGRLLADLSEFSRSCSCIVASCTP